MLFLACKAQTPHPKSATLHISLDNFTETNASLSPDGALSLITRYGQFPLEAGSDGTLDIVVPLENGPEYFIMFRNPLYLSPGDELTIDLSSDNVKTVIAAEGRGAAANTYLKQRYYAKGGSFLEAGSVLKGETRPIEVVLDSLADARRRQLDELQGVTEEFKDMERMRIKADYVNSFIAYPTYNEGMIPFDMTREEFDKLINDYYMSHKERIQPILTELASDDKYLDIEVVRRVLHSLRNAKGFEVRVSDRFNALLDVSNHAAGIRGDITPEMYAELLAYGEKIPYEDMQRLYMDKLNANAKLMEGMPAIDIALRDIDGKKLKLSDLKGKPMYVDIWATWCGPCMAESPYFEALSEAYPGIRFVAVSVDGNTAAWERHVREGEHKAVTEALATDDMRKNWDIVGIPRFLLIDADFRIISADAPHPSQDERIRPVLDKLSGK